MLYQCPQNCLSTQIKTASLVAATTKTSKGTCITYMDGSNGCVPTAKAGVTDCRSCAGIFNNVAPKSFLKVFGPTNPLAPVDGLDRMVQRVQGAGAAEEFGNVLEEGAELGTDDTAACWTTSSFECPGGDAGFAAAVEGGTCKEDESTKIDDMCDDGPCDNDPDSQTCTQAKLKCEVDPDSGVKCMPGENDPCEGCVKKVTDVTTGRGFFDRGGIAAVSVAAWVLLASVLV